MDGTENLFVKEDVAHRFADVRIHSDGKFTDVAGTFISVEDTVEIFFQGRCRSLHNSSLLELKEDAVELFPLVDSRAVVGNVPFHRITDRCRKNLSIGNIEASIALYTVQPPDAEGEIGVRCFDPHRIGPVHQAFQLVLLARFSLPVDAACGKEILLVLLDGLIFASCAAPWVG